MLVYRLTVQRQKYFYSGKDIQNETRLHVGEERLQIFFFWFCFVWFSIGGPVSFYIRGWTFFKD